MSEHATKLSAKLDLEEDLEPYLLAVIEQALEESEQLASAAIIRLDELVREEKETRANVSARPRISYKIFAGNIGKLLTFSQNQQELYKMFAEKKGGRRRGSSAVISTQ